MAQAISWRTSLLWMHRNDHFQATMEVIFSNLRSYQNKVKRVITFACRFSLDPSWSSQMFIIATTKTAPIVTPWDLQFQKVVSDHLPSHHDITWGGLCQKVAQYCISDEGTNQLASSVVRLVIRGHAFFIFHRSTLWKTWYLVRITSSPLLLLGPLMKTISIMEPIFPNQTNYFSFHYALSPSTHQQMT